MHIQFMLLLGSLVYTWGYEYDTSIQENRGRLFESHSNIGRHSLYNPVQKEKEM